MSTITPTYAYNTVNHPIIPTQGLRVNFEHWVLPAPSLGGNVNMLQPSLDVAYFRRGLFKTQRHGLPLECAFISGFGRPGGSSLQPLLHGR